MRETLGPEAAPPRGAGSRSAAGGSGHSSLSSMWTSAEKPAPLTAMNASLAEIAQDRETLRPKQ